MTATNAPNGISLEFTQAGSFKYPRIYRTEDGALIRHWHTRPFAGSIREARAAFLKLAARGCRIDGLQDLSTASEKQIVFIKRLNGLFEAAGGGNLKLRDRP